MPIPKPNKDESKKEFVQRCMVDDVMVKEYDNTDQRLAVCSSTFEESKLSKHETNGTTFRKHKDK
jgi:hypothetical protein